MWIGNRPHPDGQLVEDERQDARIVGTPAARSAYAPLRLIQRGAVVRIGVPADCRLRRQAVVCRDALRDHWLPMIVSNVLLLPRLATDIVARGVGRCARPLRRSSLVGSSAQRDLGDDVHIVKHKISGLCSRAGSAFLPSRMQGVVCRFGNKLHDVLWQ